MIIVHNKITLEALKKMAEENYTDFVKAVVDIEKEIIVVGGELHADEEGLLIEDGSNPDNLWGINLYPSKKSSSDWVEFDSIINLKPHLNNRSRDIKDENIRRKIIAIISRLVFENE